MTKDTKRMQTSLRHVHLGGKFGASVVQLIIRFVDSVMMELSPVEKRARKNFIINGNKTISKSFHEHQSSCSLILISCEFQKSTLRIWSLSQRDYSAAGRVVCT
jgi:hypothetical protein